MKGPCTPIRLLIALALIAEAGLLPGCLGKGPGTGKGPHDKTADTSTHVYSNDHDTYGLRKSIMDSSGEVLAIDHYRNGRPERIYPYGTMAAPVLGFISQDGRGLDGVEHYYDSYLSPAGSKYLATGDGIVLTLQRKIQKLAERDLATQMRRLGAANGCLIVLDMKTGGILAMASLPSWDPASVWNQPDIPLINWALRATVDPWILFPVLSWLDQAQGMRGDMNMSLASAKGASGHTKKFGWAELSPTLILWGPWKEKELEDMPLPRNLINRMWKLGLGEKTGIDLPGEQAGSLPTAPPLSWDEIKYCNATATPLQVLEAFSRLLEQGPTGPPHVCTPFENHHLIPSGSVKEREGPGVTALNGAKRQKSTNRLEVLLATPDGPSLVGVRWFPGEERATAPRYYQVVSLGFWPPSTPRISYVSVLNHVSKDPRKCRGTMGHTITIAKRAWSITASRERNSNRLKASSQDFPARDRGRMPSLNGKSMRAAFDILRTMGMRPRLEGRGIVVAQVPRAGTRIRPGTTCKIICKERRNR